MYVDDLTFPEDRPERPLSVEEMCTQRVQKRYWTSSGRPIWVEQFCSLVRDKDGSPLFLVVLVEEVTTRRSSELALLDALEQQRTAARGLRELDRVRTEVMANISHELRTPLTAIRGHLEMLADGDAGELTDQQQTMIETATRNSDRLRTLVDDLLILARMDQAESAPMPPQAFVDMNEMVRLATQQVGSLLVQRGQRLRVSGPTEPVWVAGDTDQLDRAVLNLLSNASKFSPRDSVVELALTTSGSQVLLSVRDHGRGIPADEIERVFDRFYRGAAAELEGISGTGLGLAMVKTIIDRHGGTISVESLPNEGSTFVISLPQTTLLACK